MTPFARRHVVSLWGMEDILQILFWEFQVLGGSVIAGSGGRPQVSGIGSAVIIMTDVQAFW